MTTTFSMKNLHLRLTARCNKRCEHCFAHLDNKAPELGAKYWLGIIETAEKMGVSSITLTGGEPFIYSEIHELLDRLKNLSTPLKIETNGLLLHEYKEELLRLSSLQTIALSPGLHYEKSYMEDLMARITAWRQEGLPIMLQASVILGNIENQLSWLEKFANHGIPVRLMAGHNGLGSSENLKNISFESMIQIGRRYAAHPLIQCELPGILLGRETSQGCGWNKNRADILPDGHLSPCAAIAWNYPPFVLDYVDADNLQQVWENHPYLNRIRHLKKEDFKGHCGHCDQFDSCCSSCAATSLGIKKDLFAGYPLCDFYFGEVEK